MMDIGVARPSAQGQAMMSTATAAIERVGEAGAGPHTSQAMKVSNGDQRSPTGTNHPETWSAIRWIGRSAALRFRDHVDDLRQQGVGTDLLGPHDEAAGLVHRASR